MNLWAPWELMTAVVPGMRARGRGWILNLTSFAAELPPGPPFPTNKPAKGGFQYGASKAALNRLTVTAASECEGQGVAVNALTPQAAIATPSLVAAGWIDEAMFEPLDTMAEAALALCSGDPAVLTGRIAFSLQLLLELQTARPRPARRAPRRRVAAGRPPARHRAPGGEPREAGLARRVHVRTRAQPATVTGGPAGRKERGAGARATRAALVELASELFAEQGYIQTSIRDIARRAGVTSGALYGHFRNKADLLAEAINGRIADELEANTGGRDHVETLTRHAR